MIISKTPMRISFFSGGSDIPAFYEQTWGAALSVTIDKYIYIMAHKTSLGCIRTKFNTVEQVTDLTEMRHVLGRECIRYFNLENSSLSISLVSDLTENGCGLGTSSAFTVGLLNVLKEFSDTTYPDLPLAKAACEVEINRCGFPIGKQDQYAAVNGGMNLFVFYSNEDVESSDVNFSWIDPRNFILVYSGIPRSANHILQDQSDSMRNNKEKFNAVKRNRDKAIKAFDYLKKYDIDSFGYMLGESWEDKKKTANGISDPFIDSVYNSAIEAGSLGGKVLGAGGGGFFLFYVQNEEIREKVECSLQKYPQVKVMDFNFESKGSRIIYND
jgi:D-glycero-alpha-D-manno-heptose-7-phosphate kinase